jgi:nucleoside-diphosphate kinase
VAYQPEDIMERTFAIIKPDAVERNIIGKILEKTEGAGFKIVGMKKIELTRSQAEGFYYVHKERPFFNDLCAFMSRSPVVVMVLEREDAIAKWRELMGATNPANADAGTIRKEFGLSIEENSTHGSDAPETAAFEIPYFFSQLELV